MDRVKKLFNNNLFLAFLFSVTTFFISFACFGFNMYYLTCDDYYIQLLIKEGSKDILWLGCFFIELLHFIQKIIPQVNGLVLVELILSFSGFLVPYYLILKKFSKKISFVFMGAIAILSAIPAFICINWTMSTALGALAGLLLVKTALIDENVLWKRIAKVFVGCLLIFLSSSLRLDAFNAVIAVVSICSFAEMVAFIMKEVKNTTNRKISNITKKVLAKYSKALIAVVIIFVSVIGIDVVSESIKGTVPDYNSYKNYNNQRVMIMDYHCVAPYEQYENFYKSIDVSENDLNVFRSWSADPKIMTADKLEAIAEFASENNYGVYNFFDFYSEIFLEKINQLCPVSPVILLAIAGVVMLAICYFIYRIRNKIKFVFPIGLILMWLLFFSTLNFANFWIITVVIFAYVTITSLVFNRYHFVKMSILSMVVILLLQYLILSGRAIYRGTFSAIMPAVILMLCMTDLDDLRVSVKSISSILKKVCVVVSALIILGSSIFATTVAYQTLFDIQIGSNYKISEENKIGVYNYIKENPNNMYISSIDVAKYIDYGLFSPLKAPGRFDNFYVYGCWMIESSNYYKEMKKLNTDNIYKEMIDNDSMYYVDSGNIASLETFFDEHYMEEGYQADFEKVKSFGEISIYKIVSSSV